MNASNSFGNDFSRTTKNLLQLAHLMLITTPAFIQMRRSPDFENWQADFINFGNNENLQSLAETLYIASEFVTECTDNSLLLEALFRKTDIIKPETITQACITAEKSANTMPYASFMLSWCAFCLWILAAEKRGIDLYYENNGGPI